MALDLRYGKDDKNRDLRTAFDSDAANYDRVRPRYCPQLFEEVIRAAGITSSSRVLEIGPGTGQATDPFIQLGCSVMAVELGEHLADYLREKYADRSNLTVWQGDFLEFPEESTYDLVYSATAFHWIPREQGFAKVMRLLKPGALLALFWNHPIVGGNAAEEQTVQAIYRKFDRDAKGAKPFDGSSCAAYEQALQDAGFQNVRSRLFSGERVLTGEQYVQLMRSYSDHSSLPEDKRLRLEEEMEAAIRGMGDALTIRDVMDLYLAQAPQTTQLSKLNKI